jgi:TetR/AcrR family transcriptional regulator, mexJK operon transcriptional repressor
MPRALGQIDLRKSEAILDAASEVMAERGLAASVEEIARRAGVSKQTVYNHFGGRAEIVAALSERRAGTVAAALQEPGAVECPARALHGFALSLLQTLASRSTEVLRLTILQAAEHPELAEIVFESGPRTTRRRLAEFLAEEHRSGRLSVEDPALAADFFAGMVLGSLQLRALLGLGALGPEEAEARATAAVAAFLRAYAPRGTRAKA